MKETSLSVESQVRNDQKEQQEYINDQILLKRDNHNYHGRLVGYLVFMAYKPL